MKERRHFWAEEFVYKNEKDIEFIQRSVTRVKGSK